MPLYWNGELVTAEAYIPGTELIQPEGRILIQSIKLCPSLQPSGDIVEITFSYPDDIVFMSVALMNGGIDDHVACRENNIRRAPLGSKVILQSVISA